MLKETVPSLRTGFYGAGVDLAYVPEFREALADSKSVFVREVLTQGELDYCLGVPEPLRSERAAARYAAKEALLKALDGVRLYEPHAIRFRYSDCEVRNDDCGRPFWRFHGELLDFMVSVGIGSARVSMSHTGDYAVAQVTLLFADSATDHLSAPGRVPLT